MSKTNSVSPLLRVYILVAIAFLLLPIVVILPLAFSANPAMVYPLSGLSLKWFAAALSRPAFIEAFFLSVRLAIVATSISLAFGGLAAYALTRYQFPGRNIYVALFMSPLIIPAIVIAIALTMVMSQLGLLRSFWGLVIAHVIMTMPFTIRVLSASFHEIDRSMEDAALLLGATPLKMFWHVILPLLRPGLIAAAIFSGIISFDEFTVTLFISGPGLYTLPIEIFNYVEFRSDPTVAAMSAMLVAFTCAAILVIEKIIGLEKVFK